MAISIQTDLIYQFDTPTDVLIQIEAAMIPEQRVISGQIATSEVGYFARVPAQDAIGDRIWVNIVGQLSVTYSAVVQPARLQTDLSTQRALSAAELPGETIQYLLDSVHCPGTKFQNFVDDEFGSYKGGHRILALVDWISTKFTYAPGFSTSETTALDSFIQRRGVCRDFAHVLITLARASQIPARMVSAYAPDVTPQDFHAVAEVFLGGCWHLVDPTGMARSQDIVKIGVGRDAVDIGFMTSFGPMSLIQQSVQVWRVAD